MPSKSHTLSLQGHDGYESCVYCDVKEEYVSGNVVFPSCGCYGKYFLLFYLFISVKDLL